MSISVGMRNIPPNSMPLCATHSTITQAIIALRLTAHHFSARLVVIRNILVRLQHLPDHPCRHVYQLLRSLSTTRITLTYARPGNAASNTRAPRLSLRLSLPKSLHICTIDIHIYGLAHSAAVLTPISGQLQAHSGPSFDFPLHPTPSRFQTRP